MAPSQGRGRAARAPPRRQLGRPFGQTAPRPPNRPRQGDPSAPISIPERARGCSYGIATVSWTLVLRRNLELGAGLDRIGIIADQALIGIVDLAPEAAIAVHLLGD